MCQQSHYHNWKPGTQDKIQNIFQSQKIQRTISKSKMTEFSHVSFFVFNIGSCVTTYQITLLSFSIFENFTLKGFIWKISVVDI